MAAVLAGRRNRGAEVQGLVSRESLTPQQFALTRSRAARRSALVPTIGRYRVLARPGSGCDAEATRRIIDAQDGPVVLAGHSYGGAVITEAGTHDKVAALVYISAFAPDKGESVATLIAQAAAGATER